MTLSGGSSGAPPTRGMPPMPAGAMAGGAPRPARSGGDDAPITPVKRDEPKVGRNDPCWCGSGKKFKKCHGA
jgi:preprotein translocase subunit SecA